MQRFINDYLDRSKHLHILDVGSYDVNGTYRELFTSSNWVYRGADLEGSPDKNVDIVLKRPYFWGIKHSSFDVVVSGQTLEHVENLHAWILNFSDVLKLNGLLCIIAPWQWKIHRYPLDCWRILPDGMRFLLTKIGRLTVLESYVADCDCVGIARKQF